jgi:hypothetical protein
MSIFKVYPEPKKVFKRAKSPNNAGILIIEHLGTFA